MSAWKKAVLAVRKESAKPPPGCCTLDQIAEDIGMSRDRAREEINRLVRIGRAEKIMGKTMTPSGTLIPTSYFRLLGPKDAAVKKAKR